MLVERIIKVRYIIDCGVPNNSTNSLGRSNLKENPWDVILLRILTTRWKPFCYGVLVSAKHVITQSLCTTGLSPNQLQIFAGQLRDKENGEVWETVRDILIPPPFSSFNLPVDIRVLVLDAKLDLYSFPNIKPVCLPWVSHSFSFIGDQGKNILHKWILKLELIILESKMENKLLL